MENPDKQTPPKEDSGITILPRTPGSIEPVAGFPQGTTPEQRSELRKRSFTPMDKSKVQFWHQGEAAAEHRTGPKGKQKAPVKKSQHFQRANRMNQLIMVSALVLIALLGVVLFLNDKYYRNKEKVAVTEIPVPDDNEGTRAFDRALKEERSPIIQKYLEGKESDGSILVDSPAVSRMDQKALFLEKMEKYRLQKQTNHPGSILPEPTAPVIQKIIKPKAEDFRAPGEINGLLPKSLLNTTN